LKNEIIAIFYTVRQKTTTSAQGKRILLGKNEFDLFVRLRVLLRAIKNNGQFIKNKKRKCGNTSLSKTDKLLCRVTLTQPIHTRMPELGCKGRDYFRGCENYKF
jgi:hypothetical protein